MPGTSDRGLGLAYPGYAWVPAGSTASAPRAHLETELDTEDVDLDQRAAARIPDRPSRRHPSRSRAARVCAAGAARARTARTRTGAAGPRPTAAGDAVRSGSGATAASRGRHCSRPGPRHRPSGRATGGRRSGRGRSGGHLPRVNRRRRRHALGLRNLLRTPGGWAGARGSRAARGVRRAGLRQAGLRQAPGVNRDHDTDRSRAGDRADQWPWREQPGQRGRGGDGPTPDRTVAPTAACRADPAAGTRSVGVLGRAVGGPDEELAGLLAHPARPGSRGQQRGDRSGAQLAVQNPLGLGPAEPGPVAGVPVSSSARAPGTGRLDCAPRADGPAGATRDARRRAPRRPACRARRPRRWRPGRPRPAATPPRPGRSAASRSARSRPRWTSRRAPQTEVSFGPAILASTSTPSRAVGWPRSRSRSRARLRVIRGRPAAEPVEVAGEPAHVTGDLQPGLRRRVVGLTSRRARSRSDAAAAPSRGTA